MLTTHVHAACIVCAITLASVSVTSASVTVIEVEEVSPHLISSSRILTRSNASEGRTLYLTKGMTVHIDMCLTVPSIVTVQKVRYSNDGDEDVIQLDIDGKYLGNIITESESGGGHLWNKFHTQGGWKIPFMLSADKHTLSLRIDQSDPFGVELDSVTIETDQPVNGEIATVVPCAITFQNRITIDPVKTATSTGATIEPTAAATKRTTMVPTAATTARATMAPTAATTTRATLAPTVATTRRATMAPTAATTTRATMAPTVSTSTRATMTPTAATTTRATMVPTAATTMGTTMAPTLSTSVEVHSLFHEPRIRRRFKNIPTQGQGWKIMFWNARDRRRKGKIRGH